MISQKKAKENFIVATMSKLGIDRGEAEELYSFDHNEISNPVVDAIEAKTAKVKDKAPSTLGKVLTMKAKKKADLNKEAIISNLFDFIKGNGLFMRAQDMTATKISFMDADGAYYTVAVTKHKRKPDGYSDKEIV